MKHPSKKNEDLLTDKDNPVVFLDIAIGPEKGISREVIKYLDIFIFAKIITLLLLSSGKSRHRIV